MNNYFVHPSSYVDEPCSIGAGTKIWHFSHIMQNCKIGLSCSIGQNVVISPHVVLGSGVKIQNNVSVYTGVVCEDDVFLGPSCVFTNVVNPRAFIERKEEFRKTIIRKGASVGANATIVCGCTVGCYSLVGAGSVVTHDVPNYSLVVGNPARVIGYVCKCGGRLQEKNEVWKCLLCGITYTLVTMQISSNQQEEICATLTILDCILKANLSTIVLMVYFYGSVLWWTKVRLTHACSS